MKRYSFLPKGHHDDHQLHLGDAVRWLNEGRRRAALKARSATGPLPSRYDAAQDDWSVIRTSAWQPAATVH
jgi:hypothetical protein